MNAVFEFSAGVHHPHDAHAFSHIFTPLDAPTSSASNYYADFSLSSELSTSTLIRALDEAMPIAGGKEALSMHDALMEDPVVVVKKNEEEDDEDGDAYGGLDEEVKISEMQSTLEAAMKNVLVCLIGEYLGEAITLRQFLAKIRGCLYAPESSAANREVFTWILRCMLEGGSSADSGSHVHRMAGFLEENGVTKDEIEASSAAIKEDSGNFEFDIGEKRKRREKKSISRGLRSAPNKWSKAESQMLIRLVHENGDKSWKRIAEQLGGGKTGAQCAQHWKRVLSPQIRKGSWDDQEEELLLALVERYGQSWKNIAGEIKTRTDIQCRYQYQKSCLSRQCEWQEQEDALLLKKVAQMLHEGSGSNNPTRASGNVSINWVEVAKFIARAKLTKIPRTALECKQRWVVTRNGAQQQQASPLVLTSNSGSSNNINNSTNNNNNNNTNTNSINNSISSNTAPTNITNHQFHNINYSSINSNFTMVSAPYAPSPAVTQTF